MYCAGDLVDYGPNPREVIAWMREKNAICVQGNHDRQVVRCYYSYTSEEPQPVGVEWQHHNAQLLQEDDINFLEGLPVVVEFRLDGCHYGMTHMYDGYETITNLYAYRTFCARTFSNKPSCIHRLIFGHTHRQCIHSLSNNVLWLNPGSTSYRRRDDPDQLAHYMVIEDGVIAHKAVSYDMSSMYTQIAQSHIIKPQKDRMLWAYKER